MSSSRLIPYSPPPPMHTTDVSALVLDVGSGSTRAGFAGGDLPECVIPTLVGASLAGLADDAAPSTSRE